MTIRAKNGRMLGFDRARVEAIEDLIPELRYHSQEGLTFEGQALSGLLADEPGSALVYSGARLQSNLASIQDAFNACFDEVWICYALKACYVAGCVRKLREAGAKVEVMSGLELRLATHFGFCPDDIVANGLLRSQDYLTETARLGVGISFLDALADVVRLEAAAEAAGRILDVGIRIAPPDPPDRASKLLRSGGKLGLEIGGPEFAQVSARLAASKHLRVRGIMAHQLTHCADVNAYQIVMQGIAEGVRKLRDQTDFDFDVLDIGGGLESRFLLEAQGESIATYAEVAAEALKGVLPKFRLQVEPGRYLVADAAVGLTRVTGSKTTSRGRWLFTELSSNMLLSMRTMTYAPLPLRLAKKNWKTFHVTDAICAPTRMCYDALLPEEAAQDGLALLNCGAYTTVLSHPWAFALPALLLIDDGSVRTLRAHFDFEAHSAAVYGA